MPLYQSAVKLATDNPDPASLQLQPAVRAPARGRELRADSSTSSSSQEQSTASLLRQSLLMMVLAVSSVRIQRPFLHRSTTKMSRRWWRKCSWVWNNIINVIAERGEGRAIILGNFFFTNHNGEQKNPSQGVLLIRSCQDMRHIRLL